MKTVLSIEDRKRQWAAFASKLKAVAMRCRDGDWLVGQSRTVNRRRQQHAARCPVCGHVVGSPMCRDAAATMGGRF